MTKQFYITTCIGELEEIAVIGTPKFEYCIKYLLLNTSLLTDDELEQLEGTLTILGLHKYFVPVSGQVHTFIKYGNVVG